MSWFLYCREQPCLGDVPVITDGQASCWKAFLVEQSRSVLKGGHGSKHSVQMLSVLGNCGTACLPNKWEWQYVLTVSLNTDQCVICDAPIGYLAKGMLPGTPQCVTDGTDIYTPGGSSQCIVQIRILIYVIVVWNGLYLEWYGQVRAGVWCLHLWHGTPCFSSNHNLVGMITVRIEKQLLTKCG